MRCPVRPRTPRLLASSASLEPPSQTTPSMLETLSLHTSARPQRRSRGPTRPFWTAFRPPSGPWRPGGVAHGHHPGPQVGHPAAQRAGAHGLVQAAAPEALAEGEIEDELARQRIELAAAGLGE